MDSSQCFREEALAKVSDYVFYEIKGDLAGGSPIMIFVNLSRDKGEQVVLKKSN